MSKVLIIGASGLLGRSLVKYFIYNNFQVGALSRRRYNQDGNFKSYAVDVLDYESLEPIVAQYNIVINCVGQITNPIHECVSLNTLGVRNIVDAVKTNGNYLVHMSTVSVYGSVPFATEGSCVNPESVYGALKYFAEYQIVQKLSNYAILRVSNLYGRGQTKGILGYILKSFHNNEKNLTFDNDGSLKRYYLHIDDLSSIIKLILLKRSTGTYNVIGGDFLTIRQLVALSEKALNYRFNVQYEAKRPVDNIDEIDNLRLREEVDFFLHHNVEKYLKGSK